MRQRTVRIDDELWERCRELAESRRMSVSAWIRHVLVTACDRYDRQRESREIERAQIRPELYPSGWPKAVSCPMCGGKHNPTERGHVRKSKNRTRAEQLVHYLEKAHENGEIDEDLLEHSRRAIEERAD